eukprot:COSAG04_NODE_12630_length_643_cov_0.713235_2_plen_97_part_00
MATQEKIDTFREQRQQRLLGRIALGLRSNPPQILPTVSQGGAEASVPAAAVLETLQFQVSRKELLILGGHFGEASAYILWCSVAYRCQAAAAGGGD